MTLYLKRTNHSKELFQSILFDLDIDHHSYGGWKFTGVEGRHQSRAQPGKSLSLEGLGVLEEGEDQRHAETPPEHAPRAVDMRREDRRK